MGDRIGGLAFSPDQPISTGQIHLVLAGVAFSGVAFGTSVLPIAERHYWSSRLLAPTHDHLFARRDRMDHDGCAHHVVIRPKIDPFLVEQERRIGHRDVRTAENGWRMRPGRNSRAVRRSLSPTAPGSGGHALVTFRWRSWLGGSVILFLLYAALNMVAAIAVPATLVSGGAGATGLVLDPDADAYMAGGKQVLDSLRQTNPKLDTLLVDSMVAMCGQMMAFGISALLTIWFVIRRGQAWGIWAVTVAALAEVPYYVVITTMYAAQGAPVAGGLVGLAPLYVWPIVALALGLIGLRRMQSQASPDRPSTVVESRRTEE